jgi:hypothetical protein
MPSSMHEVRSARLTGAKEPALGYNPICLATMIFMISFVPA